MPSTPCMPDDYETIWHDCNGKDLYQQCSDAMDSMSRRPIDITSNSSLQNSASTSGTSIRRDMSPNAATTHLKPMPSSWSSEALEYPHHSPMSHVSDDADYSLGNMDHDEELYQFGPFIFDADDDSSVREGNAPPLPSADTESHTDGNVSLLSATEPLVAPTTLTRAKKATRKPRAISASRPGRLLEVPQASSTIVAGPPVSSAAFPTPHSARQTLSTGLCVASTDLDTGNFDLDLLNSHGDGSLAHDFKPRPRYDSQNRSDSNALIVPSPNDLAEHRRKQACANDVESWLKIDESEAYEEFGRSPGTAQDVPGDADYLTISSDKDSSYFQDDLMQYEPIPLVADPSGNEGNRPGYRQPTIEDEEDEIYNREKAHEDELDDQGKGHEDKVDNEGQAQEDPPTTTYSITCGTYAMAAYERLVREFDTASITATLGSLRRRRSLDSFRTRSIMVDGEVSMQIPMQSQREEREPQVTLLERLRRGGTASNIAKMKPALFPPQIGPQASRKRAVSATPSKLSTQQTVDGCSVSPSSPTFSSSLRESFTNVLRRPLSSRGVDSRTSHLSNLWTKQGGPPVPNLRPPPLDPEIGCPAAPATHTCTTSQWENDQDMEDDHVSAEHHPAVFSVTIPDAPSPEAFRIQAINSCPSIPPYLSDRIAKQQWRRYSRLIGNRHSHADAASRGFGFHEGNHDATSSQSRKTAQLKQYRVFRGRSSDRDDTDPTPIAEFPPGIPPPPVPRLPAVFECPWCFKLLKNIDKPSDWTKHVLEDVEAFTCTIPHCPVAETNFFKRKADWVRHENESHRHLEWWECDVSGCHHKCYREENFTHHLSRVHGYLEASKTRSRSTSNVPNQNTTSLQAARCHHQSLEGPENEPCVFCGATFNDWKKFMSHLATHMERLSLSVMALIESRDPTAVPLPRDIIQPTPFHADRRLERRDDTPCDRQVTNGIMNHNTQNNERASFATLAASNDTRSRHQDANAYPQTDHNPTYPQIDHSPTYTRSLNEFSCQPPPHRRSPIPRFIPGPGHPNFVSNADWTPSLEAHTFAELEDEIAEMIYTDLANTNANTFPQPQASLLQPYANDYLHTFQPLQIAPLPTSSPSRQHLQTASLPTSSPSRQHLQVATSQTMASSQSWHAGTVPRNHAAAMDRQPFLFPPQPDACVWWQQNPSAEPGYMQLDAEQMALYQQHGQATSYPLRGSSPGLRPGSADARAYAYGDSYRT